MENFKLERIDLQTQTRNNLMKFIRSLDIEKSNKMPREEELCQILGISRVTLRTALNYLESDGIIFRRQGKGTFVNPSYLELKVKFNPAKPFYHMIKQSMLSPTANHISGKIENLNEEIANVFATNVGDEVYVCKKMIFADEKPCAFIVDFMNMKYFEHDYFDQVNDYSDSIFKYLYDKSGIKITWDKVEIDTALSNENEHLKCFSNNGVKAMLCLKLIGYDQDDRPIMYSYEYIDTKIIKFNQIRRREIDFT